MDLEILGLILGVIVILLAIVFFVVVAPTLLIDICTSDLLVLFIVRRTTALDEATIFINLVRKTVVVFVLMAVIIEAWALALQFFFPGDDSLLSILRHHL